MAAVVDFAVFVAVKASFGALATRLLRVDPETALELRGTLVACTMLFAALYVIVLHALAGQTIGKLVLRIRVVAADGGAPPFGVSVLRFAGYLASLMPFGLGFIMAGLRADRRALHDLLAGTRVERMRLADEERTWISG